MSETATSSAPRRPFEEWVAQKKPEVWLAAGARAGRGWAIGREVTETEFDQALADAGAVQIRNDVR